MKSWFTQSLLLVAAVIFLLKGGFAMFASMWRVMLPMMFIAGGAYFLKKYMSQVQSVPPGADKERVKKPTSTSDVIEICPHCLQEVGSCPKCKKKRKS